MLYSSRPRRTVSLRPSPMGRSGYTSARTEQRHRALSRTGRGRTATGAQGQRTGLISRKDKFVNLEAVCDQHGRRSTEADASAADGCERGDLDIVEVSSPRGRWVDTFGIHEYHIALHKLTPCPSVGRPAEPSGGQCA